MLCCQSNISGKHLVLIPLDNNVCEYSYRLIKPKHMLTGVMCGCRQSVWFNAVKLISVSNFNCSEFLS